MANPHTFSLCIACKKGEGKGVQVASKYAYVINRWPLLSNSEIYISRNAENVSII